MKNRTYNPPMRAFLLLLSLIAIGCGGGGVTPPSPFIGTYSGTWASSSEAGDALITVEKSGEFSGLVVNDSTGLNGQIFGSVGTNGFTRLQYKYPQSSPVKGLGQMELSDNGQILTATITSGNKTFTYILERQP